MRLADFLAATTRLVLLGILIGILAWMWADMGRLPSTPQQEVPENSGTYDLTHLPKPKFTMRPHIPEASAQ